ncbi:MAG: CRISPR-associated DxTHG motif protein [Thermoproteaceae archaeon]|jgi:CRISPR-associated protein Csx1|nr:CRISPR-associated DxTHG motif protein [Thermoproteaceae archaeon]
MESRRLYVTTWGSPLNWRWARYKCGWEEREGFSSIACAEADRYVVYVVDSALTAVARRAKENEKAVETARKFAERWSGVVSFKERGDSVVLEPLVGERWREALAAYVKAVAAAMGHSVEVVATGSVGLYAGRYLYKASPDHILAELVLGLWRQVKELGEPGGRLEVALDVTHGVNFMPTISLYAVRLVANVALLYGYDRVEISVWNATPEDWHYVRLFSDSLDHLHFFWEPRHLASRALYYGAPLHYARLCETEEPSYSTVPKLRYGERLCEVEYGEAPDFRALYERLLAWAGCKELPKTVQQYRKWHVVRKLNPTARLLVNHELDEIEELLRRIPLAGCKTLAEVKGFPPQRAGEPCEEDNRDFVAHAGLLDSYVKICRDGAIVMERKDLERTKRCLEM